MKLMPLIILVSCVIVVSGCTSTIETTINDNTPAPSASAQVNEHIGETAEIISDFPDQIQLNFQAVDMGKMPEGDADPDWVHMGSLTFGRAGQEDATLQLYETSSSTFQGILEVGERSYRIADLEQSAVEPDANGNHDVVSFSYRIPGQERYEIIGRIALWANGPGLYRYVVFDRSLNTISYFDAWGILQEVEWHTGEAGLALVFGGLHNSWPDISIVRSNGEQVEIASVLDSLNGKQGDMAVLEQKDNSYFIRLSNVQSELNFADFEYDKGTLNRIS